MVSHRLNLSPLISQVLICAVTSIFIATCCRGAIILYNIRTFPKQDLRVTVDGTHNLPKCSALLSLSITQEIHPSIQLVQNRHCMNYCETELKKKLNKSDFWIQMVLEEKS